MDIKSPAMEEVPAEASTTASRRNTAILSDGSLGPATPGSPDKRPADKLPVGDRSDLPPGTSLASIFRYHMGIEHDGNLVPAHLASKSGIDPIATGPYKGRRAVNLGIYNRCIREEQGSMRQYHIWSLVINAALGLQITLAAVLTALGAGNGSHDAVAVFGTLNTIIAGFLTYLKGTGLPMRMKYFHNQWLKLRAYIEQRERDFASDDLLKVHRIGHAELLEEIEVIEKMYHNIRKDIEKHTPDNFGGKSDTEHNNAPGEGASQASLAQKGLHAFRARLAGGGGEGESDQGTDKAKPGIEGRIKSLMEDVEKRISGHLSVHASKLDEHLRSTSRYGTTSAPTRATDLESGIEADSEDEDGDSSPDIVSEMEITRMRKTQARALEAQSQAEARVKELEEKLAAMKTPEHD
jgi:hypothetical protein